MSRGSRPRWRELYYGLSEHLRIDLILTSVSALQRGDRWHALARLALRDDVYCSLRAITLDALRGCGPGTPVEQAIAEWEQRNASVLVRARAARRCRRWSRPARSTWPRCRWSRGSYAG